MAIAGVFRETVPNSKSSLSCHLRVVSVVCNGGSLQIRCNFFCTSRLPANIACSAGYDRYEATVKELTLKGKYQENLARWKTEVGTRSK